MRTVGGIEALIALQGIEDPIERRRHAVKRGRLALDALDELKIGLLGGTLSSATLTRLQAAAAYLKEGSGDTNLDAVLAEIELRVEVEIAKIGPLAVKTCLGGAGFRTAVRCEPRDRSVALGRNSLRYCPSRAGTI